MRITRLVAPEHHPDASYGHQIITTYPDLKTRMGTVTRGSLGLSWTIELANMRRTFKSQEACMFCTMGFEEGTGEPPRTMPLGQYLTLYAPKEHSEAFAFGRHLGERFGPNKAGRPVSQGQPETTRSVSDMEIWVKVTPGESDEVWLVKLDGDGAFNSRFVLKSLPRGENTMAFAIELARWMNITAKTALEAGDSFATQVRYDPSRGVV